MDNNQLLIEEDIKLVDILLKTINIILNDDKSDIKMRISDTKKAILLTGKWGVGKTKLIEYALNERVVRNLKKPNQNIYETISYFLTRNSKHIEELYYKEILYVSVFGLKNKQEILQAILKEYLDKNGESEDKKKISQTVLNIGASLFKLNKELFESNNPIDLITLEKTVIKILNQKIVIIDDIERMATFESFIDLSSIINSCQQNLIKQKNKEICFILIANEEELNKSVIRLNNNPNIMYLNTNAEDILEKVVRVKFEMKESIGRVTEYIKNTHGKEIVYNPNFNKFNNIVSFFNIFNMRFIRDSLETFKNFKEKNNYIDEIYLNNNIYIILLFFKFLITYGMMSYDYKKKYKILNENILFFKPAINFMFLLEKFSKTNNDFLNNITLYNEEIKDFNEDYSKNKRNFIDDLTVKIIETENKYKNIIKEKNKEKYINIFNLYLNSLFLQLEDFKLDNEFEKDLAEYNEKFRNTLLNFYKSYINQPYDTISYIRFKDSVFDYIIKEFETINQNEENFDKYSEYAFKSLQEKNNDFYYKWIDFFTEIENNELNNEMRDEFTNLDKSDNNRLAKLYLIYEFNFLKYFGIDLDYFETDIIKKIIESVKSFNGYDSITVSTEIEHEIKVSMFQQDFKSFEQAIKQYDIEKKPHIYKEEDLLIYFDFIEKNLNKLSLENFNFLLILRDALSLISPKCFEKLKCILEKIINTEEVNSQMVIDMYHNSQLSSERMYEDEVHPELKTALLNEKIDNFGIKTGIDYLKEKPTFKIIKNNKINNKNRTSKNIFFQVMKKLTTNLLFTKAQMPEDRRIELDIIEIKEIDEINQNTEKIIDFFKDNNIYQLYALIITSIYHIKNEEFQFKEEKFNFFLKNVSKAFIKYLNQLDNEYFYLKLYFAYINKYSEYTFKNIEDISDLNHEEFVKEDLKNE
jgi:hypothetical protein